MLKITCVVFMITISIGASGVYAVCQNGWVRFEKSCYFFAHQTFSWPEASAACLALKSNLTEIETAREDAFLNKELSLIKGSYSSPRFWVGATDMVIEGEWMWVSTEQALSYNNWIPGQPDDTGGEDCLQILSDSQNWNDESCESQTHFICEKPHSDDVNPPPVG